MTDPPAESYLTPRAARVLKDDMKVVIDKLTAIRTTLAASHQPEHAEVKQALRILRAAAIRVSMRASAGHANARVEKYIKAGYHSE